MRYSPSLRRRPLKTFGTLLAMAGIGTGGFAATNIDQSSATVCSYYAVGNLVWLDVNGNGAQDAGEPPAAGVQVALVGSGRSTVTGADGHYVIGGLPAGTYQLKFSKIGDGRAFTIKSAPSVADDANSNAGPDGVSDPFTLGPVGADLPNMSTDLPRGASGVAIDATIDAGLIGLTPPPTPTTTTPTTTKPAPTTTKPAPTTTKPAATTVPAPPTTKAPHPSTTQPAPSTTRETEHSSSTHPSTTKAPHPTTTKAPHPSTTEAEPSTTQPRPTTTHAPYPTTTHAPYPTTTHAPYPTTTKPAPTTTQPEPTTTAKPMAKIYAIGDRVWVDANHNGRQDVGEAGLPNVTVELGSAAGLTKATTTDENGRYLFDELPAGTYTVVFTAPNGYRWTTTHVGDVNNDSDVDANGQTATIQLGHGAPNVSSDVPTGVKASYIVSNIDAGAWQPLAIGDRVWLDANGNGIQDAGETAATATVELLDEVNQPALDADGQPVAAVTTDADGIYHFDNLIPGRYHVRFSGLKPGQTFTLADAPAGTAANNSNADVDTGIAVVELSASDPNTVAVEASDKVTVATLIDRSIDAGVMVPVVGTFSLGNRVWSDDNHDGLVGLAEPGLDGVVVSLLSAEAGAKSAPLVTVTTAGGGYYRFDGLAAGKYIVRIEASNFEAGGVLVGATSVTQDELNADADNDGNDNGLSGDTAAVVSSPVTLAVPEPTGETDLGVGGQGNVDDHANMTVDFGFNTPYNLAIKKEIITPELGQGSAARFKITVTNTERSTAGAVVVTDVLSDGLSYLSASGDRWTCSAVERVVTCMYDTTLAGGASTTIELMAQVLIANGVITNEASVGSSRNADDPPLDNKSGVSAPVTTKILPRTGASNIGQMIGLAMALFVLGGGLIIIDRKRLVG
jgi:uncharacterized repeat protein (TIGR01451 family)